MRRGMTGVALIAVALTSAFDSTNPLGAARVTLVYVGAADCAPCRAWQRDRAMEFRSSDSFARLSYREVKSAHLRDILDDASWPADLRRYRDRLGRNAAVPLWLVLLDGAVVAEGFGEAQWTGTILPRVRMLTR
jgi:hypothetical protein